MRIAKIETKFVEVALKKPFVTSVRTAYHAQGVLVKIHTDSPLCGFGEAVPVPLVTGETKQSILAAINNFIAPAIMKRSIEDFDEILLALHKSIERNFSAKAAVDMALFDLRSKDLAVPLRTFLGGAQKRVETDATISLGTGDIMAANAIQVVKDGFKILKVKLGSNVKADLERIIAVRKAVGNKIVLRVDANQGWNEHDAILFIIKAEEAGINLELVEQPVAAWNLEGMKRVKAAVSTPIAADESVYSAFDAQRILSMGAADIINIKLMKCGGLSKAMDICRIAEEYNAKCMIGCMLETGLAINAAAQLAASQKVIHKADLDGIYLCSYSPYDGATMCDGALILNQNLGIGCNADNFFEVSKWN